jgi:hypothetical protein
MTLRIVRLALLFGLAAPLPLAAEEDPKWMVHADGGLVVIAYQVPDSDDTRFHLDCDHKTRRIRVTVFEEVKKTRVGQPITIEIANGAEKLGLKGKTATSGLYGFVYAQASGFKLAPLLALIARDGEISVRAKTASMTLPDAGRALAVREFGEKCKLR